MQRLLDEEIIDERVLQGFYGLTEHLPEYGSEIYVNVKKHRKNESNWSVEQLYV